MVVYLIMLGVFWWVFFFVYFILDVIFKVVCKFWLRKVEFLYEKKDCFRFVVCLMGSDLRVECLFILEFVRGNFWFLIEKLF